MNKNLLKVAKTLINFLLTCLSLTVFIYNLFNAVQNASLGIFSSKKLLNCMFKISFNASTVRN